MNVEDVIELINKHRRQHVHAPVGDDTGDPLRWSDGGFHRAMIQEYDVLLNEIHHVEMPPESKHQTHSARLSR
jgi:hypothetical protein